MSDRRNTREDEALGSHQQVQISTGKNRIWPIEK